MNQNFLEKLREELWEAYHLSSAISVLHWDQEVYMPTKGNDLRAKTIANLSGLLHDKLTSKKFEKLIREAKREMEKGNLSDTDICIVKEVWREFKREKSLPLDFVKELAETTSQAQAVWEKAKKKNDFKLFLPYLKKIVALKRKEAGYVGFKKSPYDALLDTYEPYMTAEELSLIFYELRLFLVPFLKKIQKSKVKITRNVLVGNFPIEKKVEFNKIIAKKIGFDFEAGRLDVSAHPFTTSFHPYDVRITTRYSEKDISGAIGGTIHEAGHALYEQGLPMENFGTPLGESISLGIHESQSRMWENMIGKSESFWKYFYPLLQKEFSSNLSKVNFEDFYKAINQVKPSLVRIEADEVTYNLHIIMRFEIEKDLIEGSIEVEDLPKIWKDKVQEYLGIKVPSDALGVLQDVHWSGGMIGYFPTYTLGNLYSAQFYNTLLKEIINLDKEIAKGQFGHVREWLRKNIHIHGKFFSASELVEKVTGEKLTSKYFIDYIENKYSKIYNLTNKTYRK